MSESIFLQGSVGIADVNNVDLIIQAPLSLSPSGVVSTTVSQIIFLAKK